MTNPTRSRAEMLRDFKKAANEDNTAFLSFCSSMSPEEWEFIRRGGKEAELQPDPYAATRIQPPQEG